MLLTTLWIFMSIYKKNRYSQIHHNPREQLDPEKSIQYNFLF